MKRTFLSRLSGAVVALAVGTTTLAAVGAATPAGAAATYTCTTTTTLTALESSVPYGSTLPARPGLSASCNDPRNPDALKSGVGTLTLYRMRAGSSTWESVASQPLGYSISFAPVLDGTARWKLAYSGGTYTSGSGSTATTWTWQPSETTVPINVVVTRLVSLTSKKVRASKPIPVTWKANPGAVGVVYAKKPGQKKFKVYKRLTVRSTGTKFKVKLPSGTRLRFVINGNASIPTWQFQTRIKRTAF